MEQFHAAPTSQWDVITKVIDECDFYLLVVGGRYGSLDKDMGISYTEKEYDYAKSKMIPVLVLIRNKEAITDDKKDTGDDKYDKMKHLDGFKEKIMNDGNTVDFFSDLNSLRYAATAAFGNAIEYANDTAGWVRYRDVMDIINEEAEGRNKANNELGRRQQYVLEGMKSMLSKFADKLTDMENNQLTWGDIPTVTNEDIEKLFSEENEPVAISNQASYKFSEDQEDINHIPVDSALLLVYAADGDGQIIKTRTLSSPVQISIAGKLFMEDISKRESTRWEDALNRLVELGLVKPIGYKGELFELTATGYKEADWIKEKMGIDTSKKPLDVLIELEG